MKTIKAWREKYMHARKDDLRKEHVKINATKR